MKLRKILYCLVIIVLMTIQVIAQTNTNPVVTNVAFSILGGTVTVTYDVADAQATVTIRMEVSSDGGTSWAYNYNSPTTATGAIGAGVATGTGKTITWTYSGAYNALFQIRIYANDETADGSPCPGTETVVYDTKTYNTVQIGTQCWLKENLNVGTRIAVSSSQTNNITIEKYCYSDNEANCTAYGGLYQWNEAMQYVTTPSSQGICPSGWHIPTLTEWQTLCTTVSNSSNALKAIGQGYGQGAGTNTSGFSGLLAGYRPGSYTTGLGNTTYLWSSTSGYYADEINFGNSDNYIQVGDGTYADKANGLSVRCLKD